jgi:hypothetical protein
MMPPDAFKVSENVIKVRSQEIRRFEAKDPTQIYSASAGVLQDMGFTLTETESKLGLLVGTKDRSAVDGVQVALVILAALAGGQPQPMDKNQKFFASVVVNNALDDAGKDVPNQYSVRATFSRMVWNTRDELTRAEQLRDDELYSGFFDKLSKAVFLEKNNI